MKRIAAGVLLVALGLLGVRSAGFAPMSQAHAAPTFVPAPCANMDWRFSDPAFTALPGAKAYSGRYDGGLYRVEIPDNWNGGLVLVAHGYIAATGADGTMLRVGAPETGGAPVEVTAGAPGLRREILSKGMAWAASSYRCNGYVPGIGLQDTMLLRNLFTGLNGGRPAQKTYLTGVSMGGHITVLGMHQFPDVFDGGLAMCGSGPGLFDYFGAMGAAAEVVTGLQFSPSEAATATLAKMLAITGQPGRFTDKGQQMASIEINSSGGPRPFAVEGLAAYFAVAIMGGKFAAPEAGTEPLTKAATNQDTVYGIDPGLGLTAADVNAKVRRAPANPAFRGEATPYNELKPWDGKIKKPLLTMHGTGDMFVPIFLERELKAAVDKAGNSNLLVQRIYRAGGIHCGFSADETVKSFDDMLAWANGGPKPEGDDVNAGLLDAGRKFTTPLRPGDPGTVRIAPQIPSPTAAPPSVTPLAPVFSPPRVEAPGTAAPLAPATGVTESSRMGRKVALIFMGLALVIAGGAGGYVWHRLRSP